jgi:hypothetical protein
MTNAQRPLYNDFAATSALSSDESTTNYPRRVGLQCLTMLNHIDLQCLTRWLALSARFLPSAIDLQCLTRWLALSARFLPSAPAAQAPNSPAAIAGLIPQTDYIVAADTLLDDRDDLYVYHASKQP